MDRTARDCIQCSPSIVTIRSAIVSRLTTGWQQGASINFICNLSFGTCIPYNLAPAVAVVHHRLPLRAASLLLPCRALNSDPYQRPNQTRHSHLIIFFPFHYLHLHLYLPTAAHTSLVFQTSSFNLFLHAAGLTLIPSLCRPPLVLSSRPVQPIPRPCHFPRVIYVSIPLRRSPSFPHITIHLVTSHLNPAQTFASKRNNRQPSPTIFQACETTTPLPVLQQLSNPTYQTRISPLFVA